MSKYNADLIETRLKEFREEMLTYKGIRTILFDADNTLYLWSYVGKVEESLLQHHNKGFYKNLPVFNEAPSVIENLQKFGLRVGICSKFSPGYAYEEKLQSFRYHFPTVLDSDIILVPQDDDKIKYVDDIRHTILVDDFHGNINQFYEAGGVAIKKSYSNKERPVPCVHSLIDLFPLLHNLNFI